MVADNTPEKDFHTILECLEEATKDFKAGEIPMHDGNKPTKVMVVFLDDTTGRFELKVLCGSDTGSSMRSSTIVTVMELYKFKCLRAMDE